MSNKTNSFFTFTWETSQLPSGEIIKNLEDKVRLAVIENKLTLLEKRKDIECYASGEMVVLINYNSGKPGNTKIVVGTEFVSKGQSFINQIRY